MILADIFAADHVQRTGEGMALLSAEPGATWQQGRTTYGGMSAALGHICARGCADDLPPLLSMHVSFVGPMAGALRFSAKLLRRGRNAAWVAVEGYCQTDAGGEGQIGFAATYLFMGAVENASLHIADYALPDTIVAPDEGERFDHPNAPTFIKHHFDVRFALPWREGAAEICWWVRLKAGEGQGVGGLEPLTEVALVADALPPAVLPALGIGVPISSLQWQANLLTTQPKTEDGWWLLRSRSGYAERGASSQEMMMWDARGAPVVSGMQSVAIFG